MSFAIGSLVIATIFVFGSNPQWTILFALIALVLGLIGFDHLEAANQPKPVIPVAFELDLLGAVLKTGTAFDVTIEITYSPAPGPPQALDRIKTRLQSALNRYVLKIDSLSDDPFTELDGVLRAALEPLYEELGLEQIALHTVDVKIEGSPKPPSRGLYLCER